MGHSVWRHSYTYTLRNSAERGSQELGSSLLAALDENLNSLVCVETDAQSMVSAATLTTACSSPSPLPRSNRNMELIQDHLRLLMEGRPYEEQHEFCDFSLKEQNEATSAKGAAPLAPADFQPVVKKSVCYIVAAVIFNENNEVLMMQEAKSSCAGQWYLPAGRMEAGEDVAEAAQGSWYRFVVTGQISGGRIKTPAEADSESLQAKWIGDLSDYPLRSGDVLPLIERGRLYHTAHTGA